MAFFHTINHKCALDKCNQIYEDDETISELWLCDTCGEEDQYNKDRSSTRYRCHICDYDICEDCYEKYKIFPTIKEEKQDEESDEDYRCEIDEQDKSRNRKSLRYIIHNKGNKGSKIKFPKHKLRQILSSVFSIHGPIALFANDKENYFSFRTNEIISHDIYEKFQKNGLEFIDCYE